MKKLRIMLLVLVLTLTTSVPAFADITISGGNSSADLALTTEAAMFSVTVPLSLPIDVDANGVVTTSTTAKLVNNSPGSVVVTNVAVIGVDGWSCVDFNTDMTKEKVGTKKFGFKLNNCVTDATGDLVFNDTNFPQMDGANASDSDELGITYDAKLSAQKTAITTGTTIANVVFTIGWYE